MNGDGSSTACTCCYGPLPVGPPARSAEVVRPSEGMAEHGEPDLPAQTGKSWPSLNTLARCRLRSPADFLDRRRGAKKEPIGCRRWARRYRLEMDRSRTGKLSKGPVEGPH